MKTMSPVWKGMLAAFISCSIFGFSFMFSRIALDQVDRDILLSWRFGVAVLVMDLMLLAGRLQMPGCSGFRLRLGRLSRRDWGRLLLLGLCEPVLYFIGESIGISRTNSSFAAVMIAMVPLVSSLFAAVFLHEIPALRQMLCAAMSVGGVVVVSLAGAEQGTVTLAGVLALALAIVSSAAFSNLSRSLTHLSAFERTYVIFCLGLVWFLVSALRHGFSPAAIWSARLVPGFLPSVLYLGALSSVAAYYLFNYCLNVLSVARATAFVNWTTVVSILAGVLILGEPFTWRQVFGSALILVGLWGANYFAESHVIPAHSLEENS